MYLLRRNSRVKLVYLTFVKLAQFYGNYQFCGSYAKILLQFFVKKLIDFYHIPIYFIRNKLFLNPKKVCLNNCVFLVSGLFFKKN